MGLAKFTSIEAFTDSALPEAMLFTVPDRLGRESKKIKS